MNLATTPIKTFTPPPIFGDTIEDTITADNAGSFEDILQKQFSIRNESALQSPSGLYGIPTGLDIQALGQEYNDVQKNIESTNSISSNLNAQQDSAQKANVGVTIPSLDTETNHDFSSQLFKFAKKHAANFYGKCAGNVVMNLDEFVNDTLNLTK